MLKKLISILFVCVLMAAAASCVKPDPYTPQGGGDEPGQKDPDKPETPDEPDTPDTPDEPDTPTEPLSKDFLSIKETVTAMGAGWNLGNTYDANSGDTTNMWIEAWSAHDIIDYEKAWGQVPATLELFKMLRKKGFKAVRIPVTWWPHMITDFGFGSHPPIWYPSEYPLGYDVDPKWMARIKEVVDYVMEADMYCIVNVHHDTGTANTHWVVADMGSYAVNCERFKGLWTQIAETFKDYDGRLLFEGYNEMTDAADSWCFASFGAPGNYNAEMARSAYDAVNAYAQDFVDAVRATGGNNATRNLIVNTYAAASGGGDWNHHLKEPLTEMKLPEDSAKDHIAFQVHYYPTFSNIAQGKKSVDDLIAGLETNLTCKGAPVIIGEWGSSGSAADKTVCYDYNRSALLQFATYFIQQTRAHGMATFHWMGITDGQDRAVPKFTQEDLAEAIIKGTE